MAPNPLPELSDFQESLICVGQLTAPHGVKGLLKLKSYTEYPADIFTFAALFDAKGEAQGVEYLSAVKDSYIIRLEGVNDREEAAKRRGQKLFVPKASLPSPDEEEFYLHDLQGLTLRNLKGKEVGSILHVANYGAGDVVELRFHNGSDGVFLFTEANFPEVNIAEGYAVFSPPEEVE